MNDTRSINILSDFMIVAGEPLISRESRKIWSGILETKTNIYPGLDAVWQELRDRYVSVDVKGTINHHDNTAIARGIKKAYSIQLNNDRSKLKLLWYKAATKMRMRTDRGKNKPLHQIESQYDGLFIWLPKVFTGKTK